MPLMDRHRTALLLVGLMGCASGGASMAERDFRRSGTDDVPLRSLEVVVVVAGPPRVADGKFEVRGFPPPVAGAPLLAGPEDVQTRDALVGELERSLRAAGFEVSMRSTRAPAPAPVAVAPVPTSSLAATSSASAPAAPAVVTETTVRFLAEGDDVDAVRRNSAADGLLIVRAVPVDRFNLDVGSGMRWEETGLGREQVRDFRPVPHEGRLLVGQAFLLDRASGVRLWSRQAPDYPEDGRLTQGHPFLGSGYVQATGEAPAPSIVRATAAARAFGRTILAGFPKAREGSAAAREALDALDAQAVAEHDAFFDVSHWVLGLGLGWAGETSELAVTLADEQLASLGPGATTPLGLGRATLTLGYVAPGGWMYSATLPVSFSASSFGRTYVRDNPSMTSVDAHRAVRVDVGGVTAAGVQVEMGHLVALSSELFLVPRGGAFIDAWVVDATPDPWVDAATRIRLGATLGLDVWLRMTELVFLRAGGDGRVGADVSGGVVVGGALTVGAGLLL